ncbi:hypothetical protein KQX54_001295 [Cotesia glomerata]|uniref:RNase H type-1 domain-containing protein n=1 Tax=Cotesia glomerata TaxID=32391 RepID=A0AAV7IVT9_COTGL|nr:hypothetical protein KQX54_001295 [Cotesia glomerata]
MELIDHDRLTTTPETLRLLFCELREKFAPCVEYYTDGSVINGKAGYAVVSNSNTITTRRASDDNSIFITHVGIPGNELADEAAKATTSEDWPSTTPLTLTEAYKLIHNTIKNHWNTSWLQSKSKLHDFRRNIFETAQISGRLEQRVLT